MNEVKKAKAAVLTGIEQPLDIREYPVMEPGPGQARLSLIASGVCGTDLHIWRGKIACPTPVIPGHEFVGRVEAKGSDEGPEVGQAVIANVATACGACPLCQGGDAANCLDFAVTYVQNPEQAPHFFGGYGEKLFMPLGNLIPIPDSVDPLAAAVFACAGPTVLHAIRLGGGLSGIQTAAVQGFGPVGAFALLYLKALGVPQVAVVLSGGSPRRIELAKELGADRVFLLKDGEQQTIDGVRGLGRGIGADLVIEASGNPAAFPQGLAMLRNRGLYLVPGQYSNSGGVTIQPEMITFGALRILGSSQYDGQDVADYLAFLEENPQLLPRIAGLAQAYPIGQANQALAGVGDHLKTVLTP